MMYPPKGFPSMAKYRLPDDLYTYQKEDANKIGSNGNFLNFSEMGVGKTPETLQVVQEGGYQCPLIVCPNSLRLEWKRQIDEWVKENYTAISTIDSYTKLKPILDSFKNGRKFKIINYETLRNDGNLEILGYIPFDIIIFDEIHKLRNPQTKLVKGTWKFLEKHPNAKIIGLSGSPIMNYPNDLYTPLSIVKPDKYPRDKGSWKRFIYRYCLWTSGRYGNYMYGSRNLDTLREETKDFTIRRTKKEVLPFLPDKYYQRVELEMKPDQRKLYDQMIGELKILLDTGEPLWSPNVLSLLTRLRQLNLDPKIIGVSSSSAKSEFLYDLMDSVDGKLVIFSTFEKFIYFHSLILKERGIDHIVITGKIKPDDRIKEVTRFQNDDKVRLCLGTIQTMGEGITLTAASTVVLADRWWNEPTNQQAVDRLHRIGQKSAVQVLLPICINSVDSTLDEILQRKEDVSQQFYQERMVRDSILESIK